MSSSSAVVLDIQFVVGNKQQYFAKELAILQNGRLTPDVYYLKPPYPLEELDAKAKWQNEFTCRNINGLDWDVGDLDYNELKNVLSSLTGRTIYVKGEQKEKFIQKYLPQSTAVINLDIPRLKNLQQFKVPCKIHTEEQFPARCAVQNCTNIYLYMLINKIIE